MILWCVILMWRCYDYGIWYIMMSYNDAMMLWWCDVLWWYDTLGWWYIIIEGHEMYEMSCCNYDEEFSNTQPLNDIKRRHAYCMFIYIGILPLLWWVQMHTLWGYDDHHALHDIRVFIVPIDIRLQSNSTMQAEGVCEPAWWAHARTCGLCVGKYYTSSLSELEVTFMMVLNGRSLIMMFAFPDPNSWVTYQIFFKILKSCTTSIFQIKARHPVRLTH